MQEVLNQLTARLTKSFGDRLVSVVLYGSAASPDYSGDFSDLNVLCVLSRVTTAELRDSEPIFHWWRKLGNPAPLLLSEEEMRTSTDCFPIEFHDMRERRKLLAGRDEIESLVVDDSFYRAQVEYQLRAKLLRLRQKAAGVIADKELLCRLLADSVSTFVMLFRHALRLGGHAAPTAFASIVEEAVRQYSIDAAPFSTLLAMRNQKKRDTPAEPVALLDNYLHQISKVVDAVDRIEKHSTEGN